MATPVEAPKLGNTVEECLVSRWAKHKGDAVAAGDVVAAGPGVGGGLGSVFSSSVNITGNSESKRKSGALPD